jgi:chromosome segregation ATPase
MDSKSDSAQVSPLTIILISSICLIALAATAFIAIKFTKIDNQLNKITEINHDQKDLIKDTSSITKSLENTEAVLNKFTNEITHLATSISRIELDLNKSKRDLSLMSHELESNKRAIDLLNSTYKDLTKAIAENDNRESEMALANLRAETARLEEADKMAAPIRQKIQELEAKITSLMEEMQSTKPTISPHGSADQANAWLDRDLKVWNTRNEPIRKEIDLIYEKIDRENAKLKEIFNR